MQPPDLTRLPLISLHLPFLFLKIMCVSIQISLHAHTLRNNEYINRTKQTEINNAT
jgi:hypothetical protein